MDQVERLQEQLKAAQAKKALQAKFGGKRPPSASRTLGTINAAHAQIAESKETINRLTPQLVSVIDTLGIGGNNIEVASSTPLQDETIALCEKVGVTPKFVARKPRTVSEEG